MRKYFILTLALCLCGFTLPPAYAGDTSGFPHPEQAVNQVIHSVMAEHDIPGMAAGITVHGKRHVFSYGLASKESGQKVTEHTTFEVGSISKTFTASLAAYAQERDALSLSDKASTYLAPLEGSRFDAISLLELGTYTAGCLPLQFPDSVGNEEEMLAYFKTSEPSCGVGTHRLYSNQSIGLLGYLTAKSMGKPFEELRK